MKIKALLIASSLVMGATVVSNVEAKSTKSLMKDVHKAFVKLLPFTTSQMKFTDPTHSSAIKENLNELQEAFQKAHDNEQLKASLFAPTLKTVNEHLEKSLSAFTSHHKVYAYSKIRATKSLCLSCHSQLSKYQKVSLIDESAKLHLKDFNDRYEYADYYFVLRDYKNAVKNYKLDMKQIIKEAYSSLDIGIVFNEARFFNGLKKIIIIKTKVENKPQDLRPIFNKYIKERVVPKRIKAALYTWRKELNNLKKFPIKGFDLKNEKELNTLLKSYLRKRMKEDEIRYSSSIDLGIQVASGYLTRYLNQHMKSDKSAEILYWLSIAEKQLNRNHFFDIADVYLTECIERFPKSKYAKKCLEEYEDNLIFSYTGSRGTDIPKLEQAKLQKLKNLVK